MLSRLLIAVSTLSLAIMPSRGLGEDRVDFNRDIRPILSGRCYKCHGPDEKTREADLRLDQFDAATAELGGHAAVRPGDVGASAIIERILTDDADLVMPPPTENKQVTADEVDLLKRWINAGAKYEEHWSFVAPIQAVRASVADERWQGNPVDQFVFAKLSENGLEPSEEADKFTLLRRVYLDLVGLPPTVEEADEYLNDARPDAYVRLVDRLLASPHYGERWGRRWLDIARYADTNGYEKDRPRSIWPYRDWVINALNDGMPYDEFIVRQFAGDMLPADGEERTRNLVATGFHRNTMINEEGGADPLEYRFHAMVDRTNTTGTALFGLTVGCVQCHTHKYDPITHTEYYGLMAFLDNADEPELELPDDEVAAIREAKIKEADSMIAARLEQWRIKAAEARSKAAEKDAAPADDQAIVTDATVDEAFRAWLAEMSSKVADWNVVVPHRQEANLARFDVMADGSLFAQGDVSKEDTYEFSIAVPAGTTAIRLEAIPDDRLPSGGPGRAYYEGPSGDFMLADFKVEAGGQPVEITGATATYEGTGFGRKTLVAAAFDDDKHSGWSIGGRPGERNAAVFTFAKPIEQATDLDLTMLFFRHFAAPLGRLRLSVTTSPTPEATIIDDELQRLIAAGPAGWTSDDEVAIRDAWLSVAKELEEYNTKIADILRTLPHGPTTLVMRERPTGHERETRRYHRGEYVNPEELVDADVPESLGGWPAERPRTRLEFAQWAVSSANPLAARVKVNRDWAAIFGTGLVKTLEDFGSQGELPSHPELLDWLAVEFMESGWDMKSIHRLIVTSATYRQRSSASAKALEMDPENRLLSYFPRTRLDAELVRDTILTASGLLTRTIGGPSVYPPQPEAVAKENFYAKFEWPTETGPNRYRRGMYTFAKRTNPYAMFNTFDGPTGTVCVAKRDRSNTPLQALTMLNDTVVVEAARKLGQDIAAFEAKPGDKVDRLFRQCFVRPPDDVEQQSILGFYQSQLEALNGDAKLVKELIQTETATVEQAAWMLVARALLNADEMIVKR